MSDEQLGSEPSDSLTADECKRLRIALIFGDPSLQGQPDPKLEAAKAKLRAIEAMEAGTPRLRQLAKREPT